MTLGDFRKLTAGLPDATDLEIWDENTDEIYKIHEMQAMAEKFDGTTGFWLRMTTNVGLQTNSYKLDEDSCEDV